MKKRKKRKRKPDPGGRSLCPACGAFMVPYKAECPKCGVRHELNQRGEVSSKGA